MTKSALRAVLIGGAPGSGKTTLARALAVDLGWTWLSGDDLAVAARSMATPQERPDLHPMSPAGYTAYFTDGPPSRLVADAQALAEGVWPAFRRVIQAHPSNDPVVIDWWLFSPAVVAAEALPGVGSVWLNIDPNVLWRRERANKDFTAGSANPEDMLANFMHRSCGATAS